VSAGVDLELSQPSETASGMAPKFCNDRETDLRNAMVNRGLCVRARTREPMTPRLLAFVA
jgi:hypothetical protein